MWPPSDDHPRTMLDSALVWLGLAAACGLLCLGGAVKRYVEAGTLDYWGLAGASVAAGGVVELLDANGYVAATTPSSALGLSFSVVGLVFVAVALRTHGTDLWRSEGA
jgi:hypothetical protein